MPSATHRPKVPTESVRAILVGSLCPGLWADRASGTPEGVLGQMSGASGAGGARRRPGGLGIRTCGGSLKRPFAYSTGEGRPNE